MRDPAIEQFEQFEPGLDSPFPRLIFTVLLHGKRTPAVFPFGSDTIAHQRAKPFSSLRMTPGVPDVLLALTIVAKSRRLMAGTSLSSPSR
ncbi:hypothetical protein [Paracidovorax citrulli]|uniref:hypothetical protein n=1 Tax=Paracidovorax citrulli TaxID=80869 RepID=UPI0005FC03A5|nr:hypothetical protein [Paracidovorax citrulli]